MVSLGGHRVSHPRALYWEGRSTEPLNSVQSLLHAVTVVGLTRGTKGAKSSQTLNKQIYSKPHVVRVENKQAIQIIKVYFIVVSVD